MASVNLSYSSFTLRENFNQNSFFSEIGTVYMQLKVHDAITNETEMVENLFKIYFCLVSLVTASHNCSGMMVVFEFDMIFSAVLIGLLLTAVFL